MGGYIGATAVGLTTTAADVQGDITSTDTTPELILKNTTETDADGSRDGKITFKGEQSGGEESTLAQIQSSHDGTADDQKGDLIFKTNDGSDGASPTERLRIDSDGVTTFTGNIANTSGDLTLDIVGDLIIDVDGGDVKFKDDGTEFSQYYKDGNDLAIYSSISDGDIKFQGKDGGSVITPVTIDMSEGGKVGIAGNTAPKESLNSGAIIVEGDHATGVNAMGGSAGLLLHATGDTGFVTATSSGSNNRNLQIRGLNAGSANANQLKLDYLGNVGIGTSLPSSSYKFVVQSSANQITQLNYNSNASFSQDLHAWDSLRAGTSSFNFGRWRTNVGGSPDSEFIFSGAGTANADGSWNGGGADYAEYFEWKDGNSDSEDRVGITVKLDGNKIVAATSDDDTSLIIGAISARPAVIGDTAWNKWKDKYETDDYGRYIREEYTVTEWTVPEVKDDEGNITSEEVKHSYQTDLIPSNLTAPDNATVISEDDNEEKLTRRKLNSSFDDSITYVSREERSEWDTVGMMGKLRIRKGQPTGDRWIKMRDISDTVEEWLVR